MLKPNRSASVACSRS